MERKKRMRMRIIFRYLLPWVATGDDEDEKQDAKRAACEAQTDEIDMQECDI